MNRLKPYPCLIAKPHNNIVPMTVPHSKHLGHACRCELGVFWVDVTMSYLALSVYELWQVGGWRTCKYCLTSSKTSLRTLQNSDMKIEYTSKLVATHNVCDTVLHVTSCV